MNGKGSKSRVKDVKRYRKNFDSIDWRDKPQPKSPYDNLYKWIARAAFPGSTNTCKL